MVCAILHSELFFSGENRQYLRSPVNTVPVTSRACVPDSPSPTLQLGEATAVAGEGQLGALEMQERGEGRQRLEAPSVFSLEFLHGAESH